jgi:hypothetical protein
MYLSRRGYCLVDIVAYKPVAKRRLCKQRPFLGNGSVNTFLLLGSRFLIMQQLDYNENGSFYAVRAERTCLREAEESRLLETDDRERLVNIPAGWKKA